MLTEKKKGFLWLNSMKYSGWKKIKEVSLLDSCSKLLMFFIHSLTPPECLLRAGHCYRLGSMISEQDLAKFPAFKEHVF